MLTIKEIVVRSKQGSSYEEIEKLIRNKIEFHCEAALKAAAEKVRTETTTNFDGFEHSNEFEVVDKESILSAYPLTNIQ